MIQEVIRSDKKVASQDGFFLSLSKDSFFIVQGFIHGYDKLFGVYRVFGLPPPFESDGRVNFQYPWAVVPLIVHVCGIHFLHFEGVEDSNIWFYLRC